MFKVAIDSVNKSAQFKLTNSLSGVSLFVYSAANEFRMSGFNANMKTEFLKGKIVIDLVRKNQPNVSLVDLPLSDYQNVVGVLFKTKDGVLEIPLAVGGDLVLDDENYLLVTLTWGNVNITRIDAFENRLLGNTDRPIVIKSVAVDERTEVNTEFYNAVVFGDNIKELETIRTEQDDFGEVVSEKQELSYPFMKLQYGFDNGVMFQVVEDQKVVFKGTGKVYLVQL